MKAKIFGAFFVPLLLLAALWLALPRPAAMQSNTTNFTNVAVKRDLTVGRNLVVTGIITTAGIITAGDLDLPGDLTVADDATVGNQFNLAPQTGITLTMNGWLTPTGSLTLIQSAGAVSISGGRIAPGTAGDVLILLNVGSQTVTFTETTGLVSAGNIALGTLDSATLVYRGTNWYQIAASNN